jgi:hypothetical protein
VYDPLKCTYTQQSMNRLFVTTSDEEKLVVVNAKKRYNLVRGNAYANS